jgi:hypothetical protein
MGLTHELLSTCRGGGGYSEALTLLCGRNAVLDYQNYTALPNISEFPNFGLSPVDDKKGLI